MPTYEILVDGQRRSFLLEAPPDWAALPWGSVPLIVGLHGGDQSCDEFYATAELDALMGGGFTPDANGDPVPQKFIAVFPQALSLSDDVKGHWSYGWGAGDGGLSNVDDVKAIAACVERADRLLRGEWERLNAAAPPDTPFFTDAGILIVGFSDGAAMAYQCGARLATTNTKWGVGALHPTCIAVAEHSAGGFEFANNAVWPFFPSPPPNLTVPQVRWTPGATCSLLHLQSDQDQSSNYEGGVADSNMDNVDRILGTPAGTALFYRWDLRMGPSAATPAPSTFDPTVALPDEQEAIGPWVTALPGGPASTAVSSVTLDVGLQSEREQWTWDSTDLATTGAPWSVRFVLWHSLPAPNGGHDWPSSDIDGWSGTGEAWSFFLGHS